MNAIEFENVSKSYPIYEKAADRLKELLTFNRRSFHRDFWALRDLSFSVARGETFCIIGENGAGKSTLLQLVAGILAPSAGRLSVHGRVSALLELGAGFNPEFTGRENVHLSAAILGFSPREIAARYPSIVEFAEIGDFIDQPVKTYSSGMAVRLAFAVAIHVDPDILLVDEALAVGDIYFRQRCMRKVHELRAAGVTIVFVSHSMSDVKALGDRTLWLEGGRVRELGDTARVVAGYMAAMAQKDAAYLKLSRRARQSAAREFERRPPPEIIETIPNVDHRHGSGRAEVLGIAVVDAHGRPLATLAPESTIVVRISVRARDAIARPNVGFVMRNHLGLDFAATNTLREGFELPPMRPGDIYTVDFHLDLPLLYPSHYSFSPAIADGSLIEYEMCDWIDNAITLQMGPPPGPVYGYIHLPCRVELNQRLLETAPVTERELA